MTLDEAHPDEELQRLQDLYDRAAANKSRSRRALTIAILAAVLALGLAVGSGVIYFSQRDVPKVLEKTQEIVRGLQRSNAQQEAAQRQADKAAEAQSDANAVALAVVIEGLAAGFATPPFPDPGRVAAVENLCGLARVLRASAADPNPPPCPG